MASIVLGLGTPHSPMLSSPPELWHHHAERDQRNPELLNRAGQRISYTELAERAGDSLQAELTAECWQQKYDRCQSALDRLHSAVAKARLDVLVIVGDDQRELFLDDNLPAIAVYWGDTIASVPHRTVGSKDPALNAAAWSYGDDNRTFSVAAPLAEHLIKFLMDEEFDIAQSHYLRDGLGLGHAFNFVCRRVLRDLDVPIVPVMLNTCYPPNQPSPKRCLRLGQVLAVGINSWPGDARVGVVASGGLSHFVVDEELDRLVMSAIAGGDGATLAGLSASRLMNSGTSEIRNWVAAAGALQHLTVRWSEYVPCYRSRAGTGCGMAFAVWG